MLSYQWDNQKLDELTDAKERGVCIILIRLITDWKPTGWLRLTITGHKWVDFRDFDKNIDLRIQQLISEIQMLVGEKLECFQGMEFNFTRDDEKQTEEDDQSCSIEEDFDSDYYYRFTTQSQLGVRKFLDIVNDGNQNNKLILDKTCNLSGQSWRITPTADGFLSSYTTAWQYDGK